ncbi:cytochrome P450 71AU50-like [Silene latifolia]|uniref:cytochrome P450 71AU50-like n=1 Tax=Silene latifolia TaxID=37657 RepID=UPI003D771F84
MLNKVNNLWSWLSSSTSHITNGVFLTVVTGFASLILLSFIFSIKKRGKEKSPSPPGPTGLPFVGYLPFLGSDLRWTFKDLADIYGPIFKVRLGTKEVVVITSPSLAKEVLRDKDVVFSNRDPTIAAKTAIFEASDIVFSNYGPELRKMKKIFVSEMLSNVNLEANYHLRTQKVKSMINTVYKRAGELVDIGELAFLTEISLAMSMVWGDTMKGLDGNAFDTEFRSVVDDFMLLLGKPNISDYIPCLALFDLQGIRRKMKSVAERFEKLFDLAIEQRSITDSIHQKDFLGCLLELTKADNPATSLSLSQVKGILLDAIIGGVDTTATTVEWAMAEILKHPEIMKNVQEELTMIIGLNNRVEEDHLGDLKYLNAVLKETLRLHPPIPLFFPHSPSSDTTIGGYTVRNNSQVYINTWAIHRDPQIWEAPSEFRPERFLNGCRKFDFLGKQFEYLPFGSGRRMCPGITLAEKTSMFVLASLLHSFEWKLPNDTVGVDLTETFGIVVKKSKAMVAVPSPRLSKLELYSE